MVMAKGERKVKITVSKIGKLGYQAEIVGPRMGFRKRKNTHENLSLKDLFADLEKAVEEVLRE